MSKANMYDGKAAEFFCIYNQYINAAKYVRVCILFYDKVKGSG